VTDDDPPLEPPAQRGAVRERYAGLATTESCCGDACGDGTATATEPLGYSEADIQAAAADLSLGCGNPTGLATIEPGDTVLDLGSGAGFDCSIAAREVGIEGHVIGVDMTPEMVETARENVAGSDPTVEFRLGEIDHLPVADATVDVVISNCVINLAPDKRQVFEEVHRVLRPGGRLAVSDVVLTAELPAGLRADPQSVAACVGGAAPVSDLEAMLDAAGLADIAVEPKADSASFISEWDPDRDLSDYVVAATITGEKPAPDG
jgi:SAM-dependent methyltransferase